MFESFDFQQMISAFIVLFAVIDIIGSIPIIINLKEKGKDVNAMKATVISFFVDDRVLLRRRCPATAFPCGYRIVCSGRFVCYFPVIIGNDTRYRNL